MAITAILGFDELSRSLAINNTNLAGIDTIIAEPLVSEKAGEAYGFQFTQWGGRGWLTSKPKEGNRQPVTKCVCTNWQNWQTGGGFCRVTTRRIDQPDTDIERRYDSGLRTPAAGIQFIKAFGSTLNDPEVDTFWFGSRIRFPDNLFNNNDPFISISEYGDTLYQFSHLPVFKKNELISRLVNSVAFIEVSINRRTGLIRRWVNEQEMDSLVLNSEYLKNFNTLMFQIGYKNRSTSGQSYASHSKGYSSIGSSASCPTTRVNGNDYPRDYGAPGKHNYSITDMYFMADTSALDGTDTHNDRLGDIEVRDLDINSVLLNPHWEPKSDETPTVTVNRLKLGSGNSIPSIAGDTNAKPVTVLPEAPPFNETKEVVYAEFYFWGAPEDPATPMDMTVQSQIGVGQPQTTTIELNTGSVFGEPHNYLGFKAESSPIGPSLDVTILNRLRFKVGFAIPPLNE